MSCAEFLNACGKGVPGSVSSIRDALETYHQQGGNKIEQLLIVWKECGIWLDKHDGKGRFQGKRMMHITAGVNLLRYQLEQAAPRYTNALNRYANTKRSSGEKSVGFKSLDRGYHLERKAYLKSSKQTMPISTTDLGGQTEFTDKNRPMESLSLKEFEQLGKDSGALRMYFCNKQQRMRHLAEYINNRWRDIEGNLLDSELSDSENGLAYPEECQMWAMDRYGNLFVAHDNTAYALKVLKETKGLFNKGATARGGMFNHSSFCAGREVICAGMIFFWKGQLIHIDNNSGHYKPNRQHLYNAVKIIVEDVYNGWLMPALHLRVGLKSQDGMALYTALSFLKNGQPDWPDQNLGSNQTQTYRNIRTFRY